MATAIFKSPDRGSPQGLEALLREFRRAERLVVAGESLCRRLPGCQALAARLLAKAAAPSPPPPSASTSSKTMASAAAPAEAGSQPDCDRLGNRRNGGGSSSGEVAGMDEGVGEVGARGPWGVDVSRSDERRVLDTLMRGDGSQAGLGWGACLQVEWLTLCECRGPDEGAGAVNGDGFGYHRLYARSAAGELRLVTAIRAEI